MWWGLGGVGGRAVLIWLELTLCQRMPCHVVGFGWGWGKGGSYLAGVNVVSADAMSCGGVWVGLGVGRDAAVCVWEG